MAANGQRIHPAGSRRIPSGSPPHAAVPAHRTLDPGREHDACGVGFVATASGVRSHEVVGMALEAVARVAHRGAASTDNSGDGAGLLTQIPARLFYRDAYRQGLHLQPGLPNSLEGGKRPFHTIIPAFAMKDGKPWLAFGLMGGDMQPQGHAQVIVNLVDFGMSLQEAGDAPRFYHTGSSEPTGTLMTTGGVLSLESEVPAQVRRELVVRGHRVTETVGKYGGYQAILRDPLTGVLAGATESRKDGCAMGY